MCGGGLRAKELRIQIGVIMGERKQIVFLYDAEIRNDDTIVDSDGVAHVPQKDEIIEKHGQHWRVTFVLKQSGGEKDEYAVYKIYLARA
jgi:hypothetical protein